MKKQFKAFTLAETLIVIMIIGVIAALTIPSIGNKIDRNKGLFKKAYSLAERTVAELVNDETYYPYDYNNFGFAETTDMKIIGTDNYTSTIDYNSPATTKKAQFNNPLVKFCNLFVSNVNTMENPVFEPASLEAKSCSFETADGINWIIERKNDEKRFLISIDVNGKKDPNSPSNVDNVAPDKEGEANNRDRFYMYVRFDGKMYLPETDEYAKTYLKSSDMNREDKGKKVSN